MTTDDPAFSALAERHRRELHIHCYRMLGSFEEAEDLVQETFLRAWRHRASANRGDALRAWLYRIATNACLDSLRRRKRGGDVRTHADLPWLQPYPDRLLDEVAPREEEPDAVVIERETIELAYIALIQRLPPRQRAVLIMREVLDWSAAETAAALQRARATLEEHRPARERTAGAGLGATEKALLQRFIDAHQRGDAEAAIELMREDIRVTMPPHPWVFQGIDAVAKLARDGLTAPGDWRLVPTRANRMPTAATYLRAPGDTEFRAFKFDVIRVEDGMVAEITTFDATLFPEFGLPPILDAR
jgi:RNA polymerase sigma-70 factor (TIGR02960 family)